MWHSFSACSQILHNDVTPPLAQPLGSCLGSVRVPRQSAGPAGRTASSKKHVGDQSKSELTVVNIVLNASRRTGVDRLRRDPRRRRALCRDTNKRSGQWNTALRYPTLSVFSGADEGVIGGQDFRKPAESNARGPEEFEETSPLCFMRRSTVAS